MTTVTKLMNNSDLQSLVNDPSIVEQIINQVTVEEFKSQPKFFHFRATAKLQDLGIYQVPRFHRDITPKYIYKRKIQLSEGKTLPTFPGQFKGKLGSRYQKDGVYAKFWALVDLHLPYKEQRVYCGLPANQLGMILHQFKNCPLHFVEMDDKMISWMIWFYEDFLKKESQAPVFFHAGDIFQYLRDFQVDLTMSNGKLTPHRKISIFDIDLMCNIPSENTLLEWIDAICNASANKAVVHFTTSIGHGITQKTYSSIMPVCAIKRFKEGGFTTVKNISTKYRDRIIPMRSEFFLLEKY